MERHAADARPLFDGVARGPRHWRHDGALGAQQRVQEAGLADVGPPHERDTQPLAQQPAAVGSGQQPVHFGARCADERAQLGWLRCGHFLLWEVYAGLDAHERIQRRLACPPHTRGEVTVQLPQRQAAAGFRLRRDERHDRFSLG